MTDSNDELGNDISILDLGTKTKSLLSALLNTTKIIPTDKGLPRYWEGLAILCKIKGELIPSVHNNNDPTSMVLELWYESEPNTSTIDKLVSFLEELDRFDIIEDITDSLNHDKKRFKENPFSSKPKPSLNLKADKDILTIDDVSRINEGLEPQTYDAFVLFAEDDIGFATELIETMEKQYKMKFCVKERDLVAGAFEYDVVTRLIAERCKRLIVIISQSFFDSSANNFFLKFAEFVGLEQRQRKVIPCIYKQCNMLPPTLGCYFALDYRRAGKWWNFWDKLRDSINTPNPEVINKSALNRSASDNIQSRNLEKIETATTHHDDNTLRPINHSVKFNSLVNLNESDKIMTDQSLSAGTSTNSLGVYQENGKKIKSKTNWFKKILHKNGNHKNKVLDTEKEKRKFWSKQNKRKVALAN